MNTDNFQNQVEICYNQIEETNMKIQELEKRLQGYVNVKQNQDILTKLQKNNISSHSNYQSKENQDIQKKTKKYNISSQSNYQSKENQNKYYLIEINKQSKFSTQNDQKNSNKINLLMQNYFQECQNIIHQNSVIQQNHLIEVQQLKQTLINEKNLQQQIQQQLLRKKQLKQQKNGDFDHLQNELNYLKQIVDKKILQKNKKNLR